MIKLKVFILIVVIGLGFLSFNYGSPEPKVGLEIGNKVPNFKTTLINGEDFNLKSLKGQMVLIDFWASYDGASRVDNPKKMALQQKYANSRFYKGEGFMIVSVSLDLFNSPLRKAIKEDGYIKALHICDLKGIKSNIAQSYGVTRPTKFLIDGDGRLVAKSNSMGKIQLTLNNLNHLANKYALK